MGCLGVHFAVEEAEVMKLKSFDDESERVEYFINDFEETHMARENKDWYQETDKAWDGIHRSLTDGRFRDGNGTYPLNCVILGGEDISVEDDYIIFVKSPSHVREIAAGLEGFTKQRLRKGYSQITEANCDWYLQVGENDFMYTWSWFEELCKFYQRAAAANKYVIFSASQ